jgi:inward rectifier potassium channel
MSAGGRVDPEAATMDAATDESAPTAAPAPPPGEPGPPPVDAPPLAAPPIVQPPASPHQRSTPAGAAARPPAGAGQSTARRRAPRIKAIGRPVAPHKDIYHFLLRRSWAGFFLVVALGFLLGNMIFAGVFMLDPGGIANARPGSFEDAFFFSVHTMATIGYGSLYPVSRFSHIVVTFEALVGMLTVALVTGLTFSKFSRPSARILFSDKMVIANRDGVPHLMFRMANWRHNQVAEAQLRVAVWINEQTREGELLRRPVEIPLVRDRNALFSMTWLAMHRIDERSPFHGPDALAKLRAQRADILVTLYGIDETVGQGIHARHYYTLNDIVWGARFRDVMEVLPDGTRQIDYRAFHEVEEILAIASPGDLDGAPERGPRN